MRKLFDSLFALGHRPFLRNVATMVGGSALTQVIALACAPILTRLYTPEDFGSLGVFMAVVAVAATIATLRYDVALVLPREDAGAWSLLRLAGAWTILIVSLAFLLSLPFREALADAVGAPVLSRYFGYLPLLILSSGLLSFATHWAIRKKRFRAISTTSVSTCLLGNGFKIGGGLLGFGGGVLIVATFIQQAVQLVVLAFQIRKEIPAAPYDRADARAQLFKYRSFPLYRLPQATLASFASNLPNFLLVAYFSPQIVGFYLLAYRVTLAPIELIRGAVRQVLFQKVAEIHHRGDNLFSLVAKMTIGLGLFSLIPVLVLFFMGEYIFDWVFGPEWATAGKYARYIAFLMVGSICNTPSVVAITVLGKNRGLLFYEVFGTGIRIFALVVGGMYFTAESAVALFCFASLGANAFLIAWVLGLLYRIKNEPA